MTDRTVRFAINVWAGWGPIIYANNGFKPGKAWKTPGGKDFKVELVLIDDPVAMRDAYAAGNLHVGWATLDMVPLFLEGLRKDSRVMPRIYQQVDWSNGGDGIVVREAIKTMADLRGKTVVLAQNSPSHFFVLNALINAGVQPAEVQFKFTQDAFQAAAAFNADKSLAGAVTWAPDIYNLEKVQRQPADGHDRDREQADCRRVVLARRLREGQPGHHGRARPRHLRRDAGAEGAGREAEGREADGRRLLDSRERRARDAGRRALDQLRREPRVLPEPEQPDEFRAHVEHRVLPLQEDRRGHPADAVRSGDGLLGDPEARQRSEVREPEERVRRPVRAGERRLDPGREDEILTKTVVIHFFPNSWDLNKKITRTVDGKEVEELYDPNVGFIVEEVGKLAGQYGAARIVIEGHTDGSMRGTVPKSLVQELSLNRANSVKEAIVRKFPSLQPNQFSAPDSAGTGRPTARIRRTTPRTGAWRSRSIRQRRHDRQVDGRARPGPPLFSLRVAPRRMVRRLLGAGGVALARPPRGGSRPRGAAEDRLISPVILPSPAKCSRSFPSLLNERALLQSIAATLKRVLIGFGLAILVGVPLGIAAGSWRVVEASGAPLALLGRNLPVAALIPLTILWFGIDESQKVMFIFIACVPFVYSDAVRAIAGVHDRYVETAQTLGASPRQIVSKVLVALALPDIYDSLRHLFGMAFGYIMLAELINAEHGLGYLLMTSQRRGLSEHILLILLIIGLLAYGIDRLLFLFQRGLFPYRAVEE